MKYGPIICDPTSEEAKALVGKMVVFSSKYIFIDKHSDIANRGILEQTDSDGFYDVRGYSFTFIREIIEEEPKYRPYKDTAEMIDDFKKRFCSHTTIPQYSMPLIWIENRNVRFRFLVSTFGSDAVHVEGSEIYSWLSMENLFRYMNYLDGSPVGKDVNDAGND